MRGDFKDEHFSGKDDVTFNTVAGVQVFVVRTMSKSSFENFLDDVDVLTRCYFYVDEIFATIHFNLLAPP